MKLVLIADTFPPMKTSGAVQLRDLTRAIVQEGHDLTVLLPEPELDGPWKLGSFDGACVLRLKAPRMKDMGYVRRTLGEFLMPYAMRKNLARSPLGGETWDGVIWYSPSIFHAPLVRSIKRSSGCKGYLIIRDIFPEWAVDLGLMGRGLPYRFFSWIAQGQYDAADIIGVQTSGNLKYFETWQMSKGIRSLEVLQNWLGAPAKVLCRIRLEETPLAGRKVFVYAGNMGVAQGLDILIKLADKLQKTRSDIGFLFVGRGSDGARLRDIAKALGLKNVFFHDEVDPDEIPDLYSQCHAGLVALDPRHKSHNIPGKFLTYMQCGLPVLAVVNQGNDLADVIRHERVGVVSESHEIEDLYLGSLSLLEQINADAELSDRCTRLFDKQFSVEHAARQIITALQI
jgi:glycosyltransferase involved in cell wall biosynthesis